MRKFNKIILVLGIVSWVVLVFVNWKVAILIYLIIWANNIVRDAEREEGK